MPDVLITKVCHLVETDISITRTYLEVLLFFVYEYQIFAYHIIQYNFYCRDYDFCEEPIYSEQFLIYAHIIQECEPQNVYYASEHSAQSKRCHFSADFLFLMSLTVENEYFV